MHDSATKTRNNDNTLSFRAVMYGGQIQFSPTLSVSGTDEMNLIQTGETAFELSKPASVVTQDVLQYEEEQSEYLRNQWVNQTFKFKLNMTDK